MSLKERRAREKIERRKQILDAARSLLFEKGLNATSMNQIAKQAEIGVGTIYFYYKSKEELFAELQAEGLELLYSKTKKACYKEPEFTGKLRSAARVFLKFSKENKDYFDIINYFLSAPEQIFTPNLKDQVDQHGNKVISLVEEILSEGVKSRVFKQIDSRRYSILFWATLYGLTNFKKLKNTILKGDNFNNLFEYSVDNFISNLTAE
ncbi:MAG: TetR/AcrR family transcriptional regulator [Desulfobacterales bacterium]